jgi:hypothetical protein
LPHTQRPAQAIPAATETIKAIRTAGPAGMQGHPEVGHPLVNVTAVGLVPLLPPNQPPEERERHIQDEIGERQHEDREKEEFHRRPAPERDIQKRGQ